MKKILITGGTGFLGRNLGIKLKELGYDVYLTARNNKQNLYAKEYSGCQVLPMDVVNIESVRDVFNEVNPDIVIHAAATKFVDLSEKYPMECVDVNVVGSQNIARVAIDKKVEFVLGISTDKAAQPLNTYGLSKCMMEKLFCSMNMKNGITKFANVRYGNVVKSTGSVLVIWEKMLKDIGVIKTTGPEMRRFFFTIDDAVNLVITALNNVDIIQGKILSREMKSAKMIDIANTWVKYKGGSVEIIGERGGDKVDELLVSDYELPHTTELIFNNIRHFLIDMKNKSINPLTEVFNSFNCERLTEKEILDIINLPTDI